MSLTEASFYFRKVAPFAVLACIGVFILYYSIQLVILLTQLRAPEQDPILSNINTTFGAIPAPYALESTSSATKTYVLDTIDGVTVTATPAANVYFLPESPARFGFRENIYLMAKNLGINTELTKYRLQGNTAVFSDVKNKLAVNITNYNFDYEYLYLSKESELLANSRIPTEKEINTAAIEILSQLGRYPAELARGKINIIYLAFNPASGEISVVEKADNANLVEVDFSRADIDGFPIVSPRYFNSQNYLTLLFSNRDTKVVKARISFFERSTEQVGTYPVKTGDEAFEDLQKGKGFIVAGGDSAIASINIKKMFMAYYDPDVYQSYLQPVYVFLGDNNFAAYVPAITDEFLTVATPSAAPTLSFETTSDASGQAQLEEDPFTLPVSTIEPEITVQPEASESALPTEIPTPTLRSSQIRRGTPTVTP